MSTGRFEKLWSNLQTASCVLIVSFGVVMWEITARQVPYEDKDYEWIQDVKDAVLAGIRPTLPQGGVRDDYIVLMRHCWAADPDQRPAFVDIVSRLQEMLPEGVGRDAAGDATEEETTV